MKQESLFPSEHGPDVRRPHFEGPKEKDNAARTVRLTGQLLDVFEFMNRGGKYTLARISEVTGHPPASVSAQLRHLRKERFGAYDVLKEHIGGGLYLYWLGRK